MTGIFDGKLGTKRFCSSKDWGNYCEYIDRPGDIQVSILNFNLSRNLRSSKRVRTFKSVLGEGQYGSVLILQSSFD